MAENEGGTTTGTEGGQGTQPGTGSTQNSTGAATTSGSGATTTGGDDAAVLAEIKSLADELGITPGQLKERLGASRKWEDRAKTNKTAADAAAEKAQQLEQNLSQVAKLLGLDTSDTLTPEKLQEQIAERDKQLAGKDTTIRTMLVERAAEKAIRAANGDIDLVLPALAHGGKLAELDPAADDFTERLTKLVTDTVKSNPKFLAGAGFPDLRQGNQGGAARATDPNEWLRQMAGRSR